MEAFKVWFYSGLTLFSIASIYISEFHFKQLNLEIRKQILLQIFANIFGENVTFPSLFIILCENFWKYFQTQEKRNFFEVLPPCVEGLYSMSRQVGRLEGLRGGWGGGLRQAGGCLSSLSFWTQSWKWAGVCWRQQETTQQTELRKGHGASCVGKEFSERESRQVRGIKEMEKGNWQREPEMSKREPVLVLLWWSKN